MKTLREEGQISIAETSEILREATNAASRIEMLDWQQIARELNDQGSATLKGVLTPHGLLVFAISIRLRNSCPDLWDKTHRLICD